MELQQIVQRYAECIEWIDANTEIQRGDHIRSFKSLTERQAVRAIDDRWGSDDFEGELRERRGPRGGLRSRVSVGYPGLRGASCDHAFSTLPDIDLEWAVEVKNIAMIGGNGGKNDFGVGKVLSPYLKDRSLMHDVARLRYHELARRHAVVGYAFEFSEETCEDAQRRFPGAPQIAKIREVLEANGTALTMRPLLDFADSILLARGMVRAVRVEAEFTAWAHPAGGRGIVFGWEIRRPELDEDFDPRHPW